MSVDVRIPTREDFTVGGVLDYTAYRTAYNRAHAIRSALRDPASRRYADRAWAAENRPQQREHGRAYRERVRRGAFALYGSRCVRCGFDDERALQIDHIDGAPEPRGHKLRGGEGLYRALLSGEKSVDAHQLLCANCNWIKAHEREEWARHRDIPTRRGRE